MPICGITKGDNVTERRKVTRALNEDLRWDLEGHSLGEAADLLKKIEAEHPDKKLKIAIDLEYTYDDPYIRIYLEYEDLETDEELSARLRVAESIQERERAQLKVLLEKYGNQS